MLLEIGVGDAYGCCFEMCDKDEITPNNTLEYHENMPPSIIKRGCYTDDTQQSIAVAEYLLENDDYSDIHQKLADKFVEVFKRDKRRGYTGGFYNILKEVKNGTELLETISGDSIRGGAAMRAAPCGLLPDLQQVVDLAISQAKITHNSWIGRESAVCVALMTHYFVYNLGPKDRLVEWLRDNRFSDTLHSLHEFEADGNLISCWSPFKSRVSTFGWDVIEAALYAIEEHDSMSKILWQCCEYAGDTDTVAAIAMGAASWSKEIKQDLPKLLISKLENKKFGHDYLIDLDKKLKEKFKL